MDYMRPLVQAYSGKKVFLTGHTGFKGSWLTLWLHMLGAKVFGYALDPPTDPAMFDLCSLGKDVDDRRADVRDRFELAAAIKAVAPDIVFHLAAQPLVRVSYDTPLETLEVNVMGTANVLEAVRDMDMSCSVVIVTSDKCYENKEWCWGYRETDTMGGADPYSMSKGATELVVTSWRRSFFSDSPSKVRVASARAGNVIGGGDWAVDRIVTDIVKAFARREPVRLRNPLATRPWQHVLEPLSGYLWLGALLMHNTGASHAEGFNFGPNLDSVKSVQHLVDLFSQCWEGYGWRPSEDGYSPHEAQSLSLSTEKARNVLDWRPVWNLDASVEHTVQWYKEWQNSPEKLRAVSERQIRSYAAAASSMNISWATDGQNNLSD